MESIIKPTCFQANEYNLNNDSNRHIILDSEVEEAMYLAGRVEIEEEEGVVVVII
jgi:hypothetical protein